MGSAEIKPKPWKPEDYNKQQQQGVYRYPGYTTPDNNNILK